MKLIIKIALFLLFVSCVSGEYLSPGAIAVDASGDNAYTVLTTKRGVAVTDLKRNVTTDIIDIVQNPNNLILSANGKFLYVSSGSDEGVVDIIKLPEKEHVSSISVGHTPEGMALSQNGEFLYVANRFSNTISVLDLEINKEIATIATTREPRSILVTPDGETLAVANFLPAQAATDTVVASEIILIDTRTNDIRTKITLTNGSQSALGMVCSPDNKYLYVSHILSRYNVPLTQLDRGWANTNALTIIDINEGSIYATLLLDDVDRGAANPSGMCIGENKKLHITLSGSHELIVVDMVSLHKHLDDLFSKRVKVAEINTNEDLSISLNFMAPFKQRVALSGKSPRYVSSINDEVVVSFHFSPFLERLNFDGNSSIIPLGEEPALDAKRAGELAFSDATLCYQEWHSCASCHPDGRTDALNWDQMNDGIGNPKSTKSMLFSHVTPPSMATGIRASAEIAVRKGILHIHNSQVNEKDASNMDIYLQELEVVVSPYLKEYQKSDPEQKGKEIFEKAQCGYCHNGTYFTDGKGYNVGLGINNEEQTLFDTPTLREVWRTAPYLYDGRANTIMSVLKEHNLNNRHGITQNLTEKELKLLELYVLTL